MNFRVKAIAYPLPNTSMIYLCLINEMNWDVYLFAQPLYCGGLTKDDYFKGRACLLVLQSRYLFVD